MSLLDIACGAQKPAGWLGIDVCDAPGVDIKADLFRFPWPVESNSVEEARCFHFVEHIPHVEPPLITGYDGGIAAPQRWLRSQARWGHIRDVLFDFWEEVYRVLVPGGKIKVVTPYYSSTRADQDPTHTRRICEKSFFYCNQLWLSQNRIVYPYEADFDIEEIRLVKYGSAEDATKGNHERELNVVDDIAVTLVARKPFLPPSIRSI